MRKVLLFSIEFDDDDEIVTPDGLLEILAKTIKEDFKLPINYKAVVEPETIN